MKKLRQIVEVRRDNERTKKLATNLYKRQLKKNPDNEYSGTFNVLPYEKHFPSLEGHHWDNKDSIEDIPIDKIKSTQGEVYLNRVHKYVDNPPPTKYHPMAYHFPDGYYHLEDGNHRVSIAKLKGEKTVKASVLRAVKNE